MTPRDPELSAAPTRAEGADMLRVWLLDHCLSERQAAEVAGLLRENPEE